MKKELINVVMQAFYGNRTFTEIAEDDIDNILQGILCSDLELDFDPNRTIIKIPNSNCVLVYNKHQEEYQLKKVKQWEIEDGYKAKPLAFIPEFGIEIYSRCFICRMNESGKLENIQLEDGEIINKYLSL